MLSPTIPGPDRLAEFAECPARAKRRARRFRGRVAGPAPGARESPPRPVVSNSLAIQTETRREASRRSQWRWRCGLTR